MMPIKKSVLILLSVALLAVACQSPIPLNGLTTGLIASSTGWPRSTFAPERQVLRAKVGEPLYIESHHVSQVSQLKQLEIKVNDQPVTGEFAFPDEFALVQVLIGQWPPRSEPTAEPWPPAAPANEPWPLSAQPFPAEFCRDLLQTGQPRQEYILLKDAPEYLEFPSSTWIVCQVWTGRKPGTYDLSLQVTDAQNQPGNLIVQRIEIIEP